MSELLGDDRAAEIRTVADVLPPDRWLWLMVMEGDGAEYAHYSRSEPCARQEDEARRCDAANAAGGCLRDLLAERAMLLRLLADADDTSEGFHRGYLEGQRAMQGRARAAVIAAAEREEALAYRREQEQAEAVRRAGLGLVPVALRHPGPTLLPVLEVLAELSALQPQPYAPEKEPAVSQRHEYLTDLIPYAPGPRGQTTTVLNRLAAEGWRLVSVTVVAGPLDLASGMPTVALLAVMERPRADDA